MFDINTAALPTLRTRQALLILDLQNEFVTPGGALTVKQPDVIVSRIIQLAKAFRLSGAGDVIWVRTQFDCHRPLSGGRDGGDQIITTDAPVAPRRTASSRGRPPTSGRHEEAVMEADEEAFLSYPAGTEKALRVRPGSDGAQPAAEVLCAVDAGRDIQFTKTHYSAFAAGQHLVQLLRGRFVTELYVCGALTNISIYATALDAGRHGYDITLVDDCCGYRSDMRHSNAVHRLVQLTGCEVSTSSDIMLRLKPKRPSEAEKAKRRSLLREEVPGSSSRPGSAEAVGRSESASREPAVVPPTPEDEDDPLPSSFEKLTLSGPPATAPALLAAAGPLPQIHREDRSPTAQQQRPFVVNSSDVIPRPESTPPVAASVPSHHIEHVESAPLEVDSDFANGTAAPGADSPNQRGHFDAGVKLQFRRSNQVRGPPRIIIKPNSALGSATRSAAARAKMRSRQSPEGEKTNTNASNSTSTSTSDATVPAAKDPTHPPSDTAEQSPSPTASEPFCEGDTTIVTNLLPTPLATTASDRLKAEVSWQRMSHQGGEVPRLVAVQGEVDSEGNMPVYRHPSDESPPLLPFTPTVVEIKAHVERQLGHPVNHVLIQLYRSGKDYISEHSDKTLDIVPGSYIANVSLGAERTMVFRTKRADKDLSTTPPWGDITPIPTSTPASPPTPVAADQPTTTTAETNLDQPPGPAPPRVVVRAALPHNSLCRMGLATNTRWLHSIRQDRRLDRDKTASELAYAGERISLTFRRIGTFLGPNPDPDPDPSRRRPLIWGQGATSKTRDGARPVVNGPTPQAAAMLRAFGAENRCAAGRFDWEAWYGGGFDVLDVSAASASASVPASPKVYYGRDPVANMRVSLMLAQFEVVVGCCAKGGAGTEAVIRFVDCDGARTSVEGGVAVMLYLDGVYGERTEMSREVLARRCMRFQAALGLGDRWSGMVRDGEETDEKTDVGELGKEMEAWDGLAKEVGDDGYIAGTDSISIADFALWPVLHDVMAKCPEILQPYKHLMSYYERLRRSKAGVKVVGGWGGGGEPASSTTGTER